jgi:hypothetical protein
MKSSPRSWEWLVLGLNFLIIGIPYWMIPYNQVNLPNALFTPALMLVTLSALFLYISRVTGFWRAILFAGGAIPAVVVVRIFVEVMQRPTSHNLWPFEVVIALLLALVCAGAGALAGWLIARGLGRR